MGVPTARSEVFRAAMAAFIDARRDAKLKGNADASAAAKYDYATWLGSAAQRVSQIQAVTHVLKATHPDARGTSLHVTPSQLPQHAEIGSHLLGTAYDDDIVGNAAALDVYKFLKLEVDGRKLLDWMVAGDVDLRAALSADAEEAKRWMHAFAALAREAPRLESHAMAKQIYWLASADASDDGAFHLLQPMFASSLAHVVHAELQDARFGDANKALRQARRERKLADGVYRDYPNLVARKLGGTKPQNISQLNSERGGVNYLLASLPPKVWNPKGLNLRGIDSVFDERRGVFYYYGTVRSLLGDFAAFLATDPPPVMETRQCVEVYVRDVADQLALFGADIRAGYAAGWTRESDCVLPECEQLWLDPERTELPMRNDPEHPEWQEEDRAFNAAYARGDWADEVAARFGLWLNGQLRRRSAKLVALGEPQMRAFASAAILDVAWPAPMRRHAKKELA